eukprot:gene2482-18144_t
MSQLPSGSLKCFNCGGSYPHTGTCPAKAMDLGLISLHLNTLSRNDTQIDAILNKYPEVFDGLGKLKDDTVTLSIDHSQTPKIQPQRRIPYHMRQKVKEALKKLEKEDIIERVPADKGTPWVSPIVIVPKKDGAVRICVDMRVANNAINRIRHPIPTVDDVSCALNGAKFFSKLDLSQAYHQLELSEESRNITTFSTQVGLFRYKRLNYDTNASAEIFQYTLQKALQGLNGVQNIADDIVVYGATREEHDANLDKCLERLKNKGLTLNKSKCKKVRGKIPEITGRIVINKHKEARENEIKSQNYHTKYANQRRNAKESSIAVGDTVLVKQQRRNKITSRFNKTPYLVVERKGTQVTAENSQKHRVTRNVSHFKRFNNSVIRTEESETDSDVGNEVAEQRTSQEHRNKQTETGTGVIGPGNRRSQRLRRPPERFGEAMPSNIIT